MVDDASSRVLVARVLRIRRALSALSPSADPLSIAAGSALESFWCIGLLSGGRPAVQDIVSVDFADFLGDRRDDIAAKLAVLAHVFTFQSELLLLGHVVSSHSTEFGHDVEQYGLGCAVAISGVLGGISHISPSDVHGSVGRESNAVG